MKYPDKYIQGFMDCLASEKKGVFVRHLFVDLNDGNWSDAAMFSQCAYIFAQMHDEGYRHYSIHEYQGHLWISLSYAQWWDGCRLNKSTVRSVIKRIHDRGLFFVQKIREGNSPRILIRLNYPEFSARLQAEESKKHVIESVTSCDRISHVTRSNQSLGGDRISHLEAIESVTSCDRISHVSISKDSLEDLEEDQERSPERGREESHELSSSRTIGLSIAEDFGGRSNFVVQQPKDSALAQDDRREDQIAAAASKISPEPPKRVENALDRQLMRQGIDPELWMRWRAKYEPFVEQVSSTGFGSDSAAQTSWANLVRQGWTPDADFWAGLDAEIEDGTAKYIAGGCVPVFGLCGGSAWLRDQRWQRANRRRQVNQSFAENGLGRVEVVHKDVARSEAKRKQDAAVEAVRKKIELKQQLALEQSDDF